MSSENTHDVTVKNPGVINLKIDLIEKWTLLNFIQPDFETWLKNACKNYHLVLLVGSNKDKITRERMGGYAELEIILDDPTSNTEIYRNVIKLVKYISNCDNISEIAVFCILTRNYQLTQLLQDLLRIAENQIQTRIDEIKKYDIK